MSDTEESWVAEVARLSASIAAGAHDAHQLPRLVELADAVPPGAEPLSLARLSLATARVFLRLLDEAALMGVTDMEGLEAYLAPGRRRVRVAKKEA